MRTSFLSRTVAVALLVGGAAALAAPVKYTATFTPDVGPAGTGSLFWDASTGVITDFFWQFGADAGGMDDNFGAGSLFGGTFGQFVFEMLTEADVYPGADCSNACSLDGPVVSGTGPSGTPHVRLRGDDSLGGARYEFFGSNDINQQPRASGLLTVAPDGVVPEPGFLVALGLALLAGVRRRVG